MDKLTEMHKGIVCCGSCHGRTSITEQGVNDILKCFIEPESPIASNEMAVFTEFTTSK